MASPASPCQTSDALPVAAWARVVAFLAPLERACVRRACRLQELPMETLAHVADFHSHDGDSMLLAMAMAIVTAGTKPGSANGRANGTAGRSHLDRECHPRSCDGLTCSLYGACGPNGKPCARWTRLLLLLTAAAPVGFGPPAPPALAAPPPRGHFINSQATEMSARQIVPQTDKTPATPAMRPQKTQPQDACTSLTKPASSSSSSSLSTLAALFQRLAVVRRRRAQLKQQQSESQQQRASWPCVRADQRAKETSLARRAQQSIAAALAALQREPSSSGSSGSSSSRLAPPQFVLRYQRRLSQRFHHKIVRAVGKDARRSESQRRSSLSLLEAPRSTSSLGSDDDASDADEFPLRMSERLSLSLGRRISRDFAPMLSEGSALECRVRELVYGLLRDPAALEGHVCAQFFVKQEDFTSPLPAACRYYLGRVRDTIGDLVEFIVEYRLRELGDEFLPFFEPDNNQAEESGDAGAAAAFAQELEAAVRRAVEEYFVFSLRYEIRQWATGAAASHAERAKFRKTLARWSEVPSTSPVFGLKNRDPQLASQPLVASAIQKLQELERLTTPSRQMESLLAASHALGTFIAQSRASFCGDQAMPPLSPSARVCLGDADSFLPLLIFAVSRSGLRDAFALCAALHGLFPFASQHGERMYYLTMFEAALEFIRNAPANA